MIAESVAISPDKRILATASDGNVLTLRDLRSDRVWVAGTAWSVLSAGSRFTKDGRFLLAAGQEKFVRLWRVADRTLAASMISFPDGSWAVVASDGRFDTNNLDGGLGLHWVAADDPFHELPLEIFMRQYYTPRLLPRVLAGERLPELPNIASLNRLQPQVTILALEPDPNHADALRAKVAVRRVEKNGKTSGARDLRLFRNGQLVDFRPGDLQDGDYIFDGIHVPQRKLTEPLTFTAYAFNDDMVKSPTAAKRYQTPEKASDHPHRAFLVNIGVNRTAARGCELRYASADAAAMQAILKQRLGGGGYEVEANSLVADGKNPDGSSKEHLRAVLAQIARSATPDDVFVLSYSGHGYTDENGDFYLFPSDLQGDCGRVDEQLKRSAIAADEIANGCAPIDACGEMVMILDACYSAASVESGDFRPGPIGSKGLGQLAYDKRIRILTASQSRSGRRQTPWLGMGLLSYALVRDRLEAGHADWHPKDEAVWLREWLQYAVQRVPELYEALRTGTTSEFGKAARGAKSFPRNANYEHPSLQTPALFDFTAKDNQGVRIQ